MRRIVETERLTLKILDESATADVLKYYWDNQFFLRPWEPQRQDGFLTYEIQALCLNLDQAAMERGEMIRYWIFLKDGTGPIGTIALTNIIRGVFKSCFMGYKLSENLCNQGYMTEAIGKVIEIAFDELKLHRIEANIMPLNVNSIRVVRKLGFQLEGTSKEYLKINGKWEDHSRFSLINDRFEEV